MAGIVRCEVDERQGRVILVIELPCPMRDIEDRYISLTVERCGGNRRRAAVALGVSERTVSRRLNRRRNRL